MICMYDFELIIQKTKKTIKIRTCKTAATVRGIVYAFIPAREQELINAVMMNVQYTVNTMKNDRQITLTLKLMYFNEKFVDKKNIRMIASDRLAPKYTTNILE